MEEIEKIRDIFSDYSIGINGEEEMKRCAVLIPIVEIGGEECILFEIRNNKLSINPGEICFPGGAIEEGESAKEAALRETLEEIGVVKEHFEVITQLDYYISPNNILIYPFLALEKKGRVPIEKLISINKNEVYGLLSIPLSYFLNYEEEIVYNRILNVPKEDFPFENVLGGKDYKFREGRYKIVFYKYKDFVIWGITARILENFLRVYKGEEKDY